MTDGGGPGRRRRWARVVVVAVAIFVAAVVPVPTGGRPSFGPLGPDKLLHLLAHGVLAGTLADAVDGRRIRMAAAVAAVASAAYGVGIEVLQLSIPTRTFERADAAAAVLGGVAGAVGWWLRRSR